MGLRSQRSTWLDRPACRILPFSALEDVIDHCIELPLLSIYYGSLAVNYSLLRLGYVEFETGVPSFGRLITNQSGPQLSH